MKFSCERCGKRYATADRPAPGRVYTLKCKACGHLIVLELAADGIADAAQRGDPAERLPAAGGAPSAAAVAEAGGAPEVSLEIGAPEPADLPPPAPAPQSFVDAATTEITMPPPVPGASPAEGGYVDLFSDVAEPDAPDPFVAAPTAKAEPTARRVVPPVPKVRVIPKPPPQRSALPFVFLGIGVLVLLGILAFVMASSDTRAPAAAPEPPSAQAGPPPAPPAPAAEPAPPAAPAPVEPPPRARARR